MSASYDVIETDRKIVECREQGILSPSMLEECNMHYEKPI